MAEQLSDDQAFDWYRRRVKALEDLLACYRIGHHPGERLFVELDETRAHIDDRGNLRADRG